MKLTNTPEPKLALLAVSRPRFPEGMVRRRLAAVADACTKLHLPVTPAETVVKTEADALGALDELQRIGADAAVVYLANFGPEVAASLFSQRFRGSVMLCAAAEESADDLYDGRGDALCGLLSASCNHAMRNVAVHIPEAPVGSPDEIARMIAHFLPVVRTIVGLKHLKIFAFGPRPHEFITCYAPIKPLFDLGVEVMENSELDLLLEFQKAEGHKDVDAVASDMARELGTDTGIADLLPKLARHEIALLNFMDKNLGASRYAVFANKCWPAFQPAFGFAPCYVNSRLAARGIPVGCEGDIYGGLSEYMAQCASGAPVTLLDVNNSVPADLPPKDTDLRGATPADLFMAFHCGNTPACQLAPGFALKHQPNMHRILEPDKAPDISRGTLEGALRPGPVTLFRLQSTPDSRLRSYVAEGECLPVDPRSFGGIGVMAIPDFARFYRHVLIQGRFPHHAALAFRTVGGALFDALTLLGVDDIGHPLPVHERYPTENPFPVDRASP